MAEKEKSEKKAKKLKAITHHKAEGGGYVHEHHYEGEKGGPDTSTFAGFSPDLADVHQHIDDHLGPPQGGADEQAEAEAPQGGAGASTGTQGPAQGE